MKQVVKFNIRNAGTIPHYCLRNVRMGYGIDSYYEYALQDWQNNIQHKNDDIPAGVDVPVYWNWWGTVEGVYRNWGHIGVRLADGRVWTDGRYFGSVHEVSNTYLKNGKGQYLGWGEKVNNVKVIERDSMYKLTRHGQDVLNRFLLGRNTPEGLRSRVGEDDFDLESTRYQRTSAYKTKIEQAKAGRLDVVNHLPLELRKAYVNPLASEVAELKKSLASKDKEIASLKAQVGDNTKWETLKALIRELIGSK